MKKTEAIEKNKVLESWIMVEQLTEGDISLKDNSIIGIHEVVEKNYYDLLIEKIQKKKMQNHQKAGIVIYFGVFPFKEIIDILMKKYSLSKNEQEISVGDKFSFALYFDKELKILSELTFLTVSYYIRKNGEIPKLDEFKVFEEKHIKKFQELFECQEDVDYKEHFNKAIASILKEFFIEPDNCRIKILLNYETEAVNLHSFFVGDLEKAKTIETNNLNDYILGKEIERVDLNSRIESKNFNSEPFNIILQPKNYPLARFPSNPQYSLSLMQQVAVNLSIGYDNEPIRSVNGPPGTGKSTLLYDIFVEFVVKQAYEISNLSEKFIKGSEETKYCIGILPESIAEKGLVVASSNNGAVQNIVNELPLLSKIDKEFLEEIVEADYFKEIANSRLKEERKKDNSDNTDEVLKNEESDKFWGLFSLEGGKKTNMNYIVTVLKNVENYLDKEYKPNNNIYSEFIEQYKEVYDYRESRQILSDNIAHLNKLLEDIRNKEKLDEKEKNEIISFENKINEHEVYLTNLQDMKNSVMQCIEALKLQKPGFFSLLFPSRRGNEYKERLKTYSNELQELILDEKSAKEKNVKIKKQLKKMQFNKTVIENEIDKLVKQSEKLKEQINSVDVKGLDFSIDYDSLQLNNPWFDIKYRRLQSKLFIAALKVRKEFLYENLKNIKAAYKIWRKQKEYSNRVIKEAWNWINMVIPVISSTFASFSRMCANMEKETIGHLFIDEAGQALPHASVGAIFRSRHIMVVGDPCQIKPVLTLDSSILSMLGEFYGVSSKYLSENASTQTLVDEISQYGFYKDERQEEWIGIPLWVHRRCKHPMFDISNKISYGGNMVQGIKKNGVAKWFDIRGVATNKFVKEQGDFLREKIQEMIRENPDIIEKEIKDEENKNIIYLKDIIYVISPFKNVAYQLSCELREIKFYDDNGTNKIISFTRYDDNGKPTNVGTVHTFQGKEAKIVFLVLGADDNCKGAANWAMGTENPNIMNVAATRAKEEFYIIGDKELYKNLNSDVINNTYEIIDIFNRKNNIMF